MRRFALGGALALLLSACSGPPWWMGSPRNGHPSIPKTRKNLTWKEWQRSAETARAQREFVYEVRALVVLDDLQRLTSPQKERLASLLEGRAAEFHAQGRAIPESRDLDRLEHLSPSRAAGLLGEHALADRAAGDAWLAVGAIDEARAAYERAARLGATDLEFRVRALWGHPPPQSTTLAELRAAVAELPLRAVPPFGLAYVTRGGRDRATIARALAAARQEKMSGLAVRAEEALQALDAQGGGPDGGAGPDRGAGDEAVEADGGVSAPDAAVAPVPPNLSAWLLGGLTLSGRLLPLLRAHPEIFDDAAAAVEWVDLLLDEDDTSPDTLALAATTFGRVGRFGGTERMLMELTYATPDRAEGFARGAAIWERLGRTRQACVAWIRAARWRDDPADPTWRTAIGCARRDPGAADWREIRGYVLALARPDRRAALAAALDAP